jgi:predicted RNA-binding protein with EMAP domain
VLDDSFRESFVERFARDAAAVQDGTDDRSDKLSGALQAGEIASLLGALDYCYKCATHELLQTEDVATSDDTVGDNLDLSGKWFINFLDASIRYYLTQKQKAARPTEASKA